MIRLAYNDSGILLKVEGEYWIVNLGSKELEYINQEEYINIQGALNYFTLHYGKPTWTRENINKY